MAGFTLRKSDADPIVEIWTKGTSSDTGNIGELWFWDAGADAAEEATASTESCDRVGVLMESTANGDTTIRVQIPTPTQLWEATANATSNTAHTGANMKLTNEFTVNNTSNSTDSEALVVQVNIIGATGDKRLLVRFSQMGNGLLNM